MYKITVFTPAYNRAYIIGKLYESLCKQTFKEFEWIVVDDGSKDNTKQVVEEYTQNKKITVNYYYQNNAGKHSAINYGITKAQGELFIIVDSDDILTEDALAVIWNIWQGVDDKDKFIGVGGLRGYNNTQMIGNSFAGDELDATAIELRYKYNIIGDKAEVFRTDILKKYRFPIFEGEKFVTEAVVWNRIARDGYKFRWFNKIIYIGNYLQDGLTQKYEKLLINNCQGTALYYEETLNTTSITDDVKKSVIYPEYIKYGMLSGEKINCLYNKSGKSKLFLLALPSGVKMYLIYTIKQFIKRIIRYDERKNK